VVWCAFVIEVALSRASAFAILVARINPFVVPMAERRMKILRIGLLAGLALGAAPAIAIAQATTEVARETVPFEREQENACNGELVTITGEVKITTRRTVDANGVTHFMINFVPSNLEGVGASGKYKIVGAEKSHEELIEGQDYPFSQNYTSQYNVVSQGKAPNYKVTETSRITIDADGTLLHEFVHFRSTCTGPG
jgi:hypothetical protein